MYDNFRLNLRYLCGQYKSVADVCRRIEINRQQFNKYLGGQSEPSAYNMRKICNFFGVEEGEIYGPHQEFVRLFEYNSSLGASEHARSVGANFFPAASNVLRRYVGYYFTYIISPSIPGRVIKAITQLELSGDQVITKTYERVKFSESGLESYSVNKYRGFAYESADLIYLVEHEYLSNRGYIFTALYQTHLSRLDVLNGLVLGVSGGNFRRPFCSQIAFEFKGENPDLRELIGGCGCFETESKHIPRVVRMRIQVPPSHSDFNMTPPVF